MAKSKEEVDALLAWARKQVAERSAAGWQDPDHPTSWNPLPEGSLIHVAAPKVTVPVTVQAAPPPTFDWLHTHEYDRHGRLTKTISTRVPRTEAPSTD